MFSKHCSSCDRDKDLNDFSPQKKNTEKLYAWCDECRKASHAPQLGKANKQFFSEIASLQAKALELRRFKDPEVAEIRAERNSGAEVKEIALKHNASVKLIYKVLAGKGTYGKVQNV